MEKKITTLKDIQRRIQDLDARDGQFNEQYKNLSGEALDCMEGINDMQEKNWIQKGQNIIEDEQREGSTDAEHEDQALSYLKEAVNTVLLRKGI